VAERKKDEMTAEWVGISPVSASASQGRRRIHSSSGQQSYRHTAADKEKTGRRMDSPVRAMNLPKRPRWFQAKTVPSGWRCCAVCRRRDDEASAIPV
jgi:hypothetical protein